MSNHVSGFRSFFLLGILHHIVLAKLVTSGIRVKNKKKERVRKLGLTIVVALLALYSTVTKKVALSRYILSAHPDLANQLL